jgi:23S rRNA (cytosine1962-C5)-methyltransferase
VRPGIERRSAGAKVSALAARALRSGHPWVFREALARQGVELELGAVLPVVDPEGYRLGWGLFDPEGAVALRMLSNDPDFVWNAETMAARIDAALVRRESWTEASVANCCRLIHGEADGFPGVAVDRLGEYLLVYKYSRCAESYLDTLIPLLDARLKPAGIYLQDRVRPVQASDRRPPAFHMAGKNAPPELVVEEDGLHFVVDITAPVSPGLFLDLREGRRMVERAVRGKTVLNLFSFTGAFGVRAIRGGAAQLTNIDSAARSHARCRQNLSASGMDPEACEALTGDVFKFLERFRERGRTFDFVIVDPPPFSNVDGSVFSAMRDWSELMRAVAEVVAPNGQVLAVCNAAGLSDQEFLNALGEGTCAARRHAVLLGEWGLPPDFPVIPAFSEGRYLKTKLLALV